MAGAAGADDGADVGAYGLYVAKALVGAAGADDGADGTFNPKGLLAGAAGLVAGALVALGAKAFAAKALAV